MKSSRSGGFTGNVLCNMFHQIESEGNSIDTPYINTDVNVLGSKHSVVEAELPDPVDTTQITADQAKVVESDESTKIDIQSFNLAETYILDEPEFDNYILAKYTENVCDAIMDQPDPVQPSQFNQFTHLADT